MRASIAVARTKMDQFWLALLVVLLLAMLVAVPVAVAVLMARV